MNLKKIKEYCEKIGAYEQCPFNSCDEPPCYCMLDSSPEDWDIEAIEKAYKEIEDVKLH